MPSSCFFSFESSWAFFGSFQTAGSSREALTVFRRSDLASKSKIPPKGLRAGGEIGQLRADRVDVFCVHVVLPMRKRQILARRCHCRLDPQSSDFGGRRKTPDPGLRRDDTARYACRVT